MQSFLNHFEMYVSQMLAGQSPPTNFYRATVISNLYFGLISTGYKNPSVLMQVNW